MTEDELNAYVEAACRVQGIAPGEEARARIQVQFERLAAVAAPLMREALGPHEEPAPVSQA